MEQSCGEYAADSDVVIYNSESQGNINSPAPPHVHVSIHIYAYVSIPLYLQHTNILTNRLLTEKLTLTVA